jgi:hypothetical protein
MFLVYGAGVRLVLYIRKSGTKKAGTPKDLGPVDDEPARRGSF